MKPFLKWAGNKYRIIDQIKSVLPEGKRLIEPFAGTAAVFLNTPYSEYLLADTNIDLINLFDILKTEKGNFIDFSKQYFSQEYNTETEFYRLRELFNTTNDKHLKSALFVYLNKHAYNGLCRYNASGKFNVPYGKYKSVYFPENEMHYFSQKLQHATLLHADFETSMNLAEANDVIYCDPPYMPLSKTANFTKYQGNDFSIDQQIQLANLAEKLSAKNIPVIISNHKTDFILQIYHKAKIITFDVQRHISCKGSNRTKIAEVLAVFS